LTVRTRDSTSRHVTALHHEIACHMSAVDPDLALWTKVDGYIANALFPADPILEDALRASTDAGLPDIQVSPAQGRFLQLLARMQKSVRILELGTLGGYSTICLARALGAGGRLITLEADAKHAEVARANFARAGLSGVVELRLGPALDTLPKLVAEGAGPFDFVFIDADKVNIPEYFQWALKLTRAGSLIVVDNVVRKGALIDPANPDPSVRGVRRFHDLLAKELRVSATTLQTVGSKGYDGLTLALVVG
jgi:predicted O-methyltransferase YrrM